MIRRSRKWLVAVTLAGLVSSAGSVGAIVTISPAFVEIPLDRGRPAGQFVIANTSDETERYRINALHFTFGESGNLQMIPPDGNSLAPWIKFNPKEISLPPKSNVKVRFTIVPKEKLENREYWAAMELESLRPNTASSQDAAGRTMTLEVVSAIVVPIFATNGRMRHACRIVEVALRTGETSSLLETRLVNAGTGHLALTGTYQISDASGNVVAAGNLGGDYVLAGAARRFTLTLPSRIPPGEYLVRVEYRAAQLEKPVVHEVKNVW